MTRAEKRAATKAAREAAAVATTIITETATPSAEDGVVEDVVAKLAAIEGETTPLVVSEQPQDFDALLASFTDDEVDAKLSATIAAIAERSDFEKVKAPDNVKIQKTLDNVHKALCFKPAARVMLATAVDPATFNRVIHEGARYNVYAMGKLADAIHGLANFEDGKKGVIANAINIACMKSLFQFRAAGMTFTLEMAKCAASDKIRIERAVSDHLRRHTVSASTAPTQASSTMQALETLGVVTRNGLGKNPTFTLSAHPVTEKLRMALAA